ncbi:MAG: hypothetical protein OGMRLDGQ_002600 [Candidatus Fervidibacter sp.]
MDTSVDGKDVTQIVAAVLATALMSGIMHRFMLSSFQK